MRRNSRVLLAAVCVVMPVMAGCGGGGGGSSTHTYVVVPPAKDTLAKGIYVTFVSPVAMPTNVLTKSGARIVGEAHGPQVCSYTKTVQGSHGPLASLSGKTVTVKVNGSTSIAPMVCSVLKKLPFNTSDVSKLGGG